MPQIPLPPGWAIVLTILFVLFGGGGGVVWLIRREIRETRAAPALEESQRLENEKATQELAKMLREAQREALAEMRGLLEEARRETESARLEAHAAREEAAAARAESRQLRREIADLEGERQRDRDAAHRFRVLVEELLRAHKIDLPPWWHTQG